MKKCVMHAFKITNLKNTEEREGGKRSLTVSRFDP